nr:LuxR C-terminal-related transcriptional regulator [Streptomyces pactum]
MFRGQRAAGDRGSAGERQDPAAARLRHHGGGDGVRHTGRRALRSAPPGPAAPGTPTPAPPGRRPQGRPLLLLLDEADRLGEEAADTLLARRAGLHGGNVVSVVAHRSGKGPEALGAILATPTGRRARITLEPLRRAACASIVSDVLGTAPSPGLLQLVDEAAGHPRLIVSLLTGLREENALRTVDGQAHPVGRVLPRRVTAQVAATLETFSPDCRQLLRTAAVLGRELDYEVLAPLLGTTPSGLVRLLDEAVATGALDHSGARTVFRGALLHQVIAESVPASLKRALRREADQVRRLRAREEPAAAGGQLNDRQHAVVQLVGQGLTNQQIARRLDVSPHTVNYHLRKLYGNYGVRSRIGLLRAVQDGVRANAG